MNEGWKKNRGRLIALLVLLVVALGGLLVFEAKQNAIFDGDGGVAAGAPAGGFAPPANDAEAEALLMKEVEAGRQNREPGTFAFVFRESSERSEACAWMCLDLAVAPGLDVHLVAANGSFCSTKTLEPTLFRGEAYEFPATPLERTEGCSALGEEIEVALFGAAGPKFTWIDLKRESSSKAAELQKTAKDAALKARLIADGARAEGGASLSEDSTILPPEVSTLPTPEGAVTLKTWRWSDANVNTSADEVSRGSTEYNLPGGTPQRVRDNGLFCSEVPAAFNLNGEIYILFREWGCNSGVSCRGLLKWSKDHFENSYGNCNFST